MSFPQFTQSHLLRGSTLLMLRQHGLYVAQRNRRGVAWLETEIPYEELLPVSLEYHQPAPVRVPRPVLWVSGWLLIQTLSHLVRHTDYASPVAAVAAGCFLVGLLAAVLRPRLNRTVTFVTNRLRLTLPDRGARQRAALETFLNQLQHRIHGYLREEYACVNPLGPIDIQLHRLDWLHRIGVLPELETRALSTRLTGRLSLHPLKLMGQKLETPYVN